jgi:hypothetical protein
MRFAVSGSTPEEASEVGGRVTTPTSWKLAAQLSPFRRAPIPEKAVLPQVVPEAGIFDGERRQSFHRGL